MYLSTEVTNHKLYTLMHDPQYRAEAARRNTSYNQPSYTDFYLASDMDFGDVPLRSAWLPGSVKALQHVLEDLVESGDVAGPVASQLGASRRHRTRSRTPPGWSWTTTRRIFCGLLGARTAAYGRD